MESIIVVVCSMQQSGIFKGDKNPPVFVVDEVSVNESGVVLQTNPTVVIRFNCQSGLSRS
jgi:hypothetical protein